MIIILDEVVVLIGDFVELAPRGGAFGAELAGDHLGGGEEGLLVILDVPERSELARFILVGVGVGV